MSKKNEIQGLVVGLVAILAAVCFFLLGFLKPGSWSYAWLVFLAVPVAAITMDIVSKNRDFYGSVIGLIAILATVVYFVLGLMFGKWHPGWLVFLAVPIAAITFDISKKKDVPGAIVGLVAVLSVVAFILMGTILGIWYIAWLVFLLIPITAIIINIVKVASQDGYKQE
jgi:CDP-diglyceride synthetase